MKIAFIILIIFILFTYEITCDILDDLRTSSVGISTFCFFFLSFFSFADTIVLKFFSSGRKKKVNVMQESLRFEEGREKERKISYLYHLKIQCFARISCCAECFAGGAARTLRFPYVLLFCCTYLSSVVVVCCCPIQYPISYKYYDST